jgi:hypothetical protein
VAFSGSTYLVVWHEVIQGDFDIRARRLDAAGQPLAGAFTVAGTGAVDEMFPDVAWNGETFLVVWQEEIPSTTDFTVEGQRVLPGGGLTGDVTPMSFVPGNQRLPAVAASGNQWLVVWQDLRNGNEDIFGTRVPAIGSVLDPNGIPIITNTKNDTVPDVAGSGANYLVVYQLAFSATDPDVNGRIVNNAGAPSAFVPISQAPYIERDPAVAFGDSQYHVVWEDAQQGDFNIRGRRVATNGTAQDFYLVTDDEEELPQQDPTIAFSGVFLVAWRDARGGGTFPPRNIRAARVEGDGTVVDFNGFVVAETSGGELDPAVSRGPDNKWGVAYTLDAGVALRTVSK